VIAVGRTARSSAWTMRLSLDMKGGPEAGPLVRRSKWDAKRNDINGICRHLERLMRSQGAVSWRSDPVGY